MRVGFSWNLYIDNKKQDKRIKRDDIANLCSDFGVNKSIIESMLMQGFKIKVNDYFIQIKKDVLFDN